MAENKNSDKLSSSKLPDSKLEGREVILELRPVGNIMRVLAMDIATKTEIIIQCPISAGDAVFKKNALLRLEYVLKKDGIVD